MDNTYRALIFAALIGLAYGIKGIRAAIDRNTAANTAAAACPP